MDKRPWEIELEKVNQCTQRQDSITDQMIDLHYIANKFGFYDAADYIKRVFIENIDKDIPIENLDFSLIIYNSLKRYGINYKNQLENMTESELSKVRNLSQKRIEEIKKVIDLKSK